MGGNHIDPGVYFRAPADVRQNAANAAAEAGWTLQDLLLACLYATCYDPASVLAVVGPHRQPRRPSGRPRKAAKK